MNFSATLAFFEFPIVPVPKLRHRVRRQGGFIRQHSHPKTDKFEKQIAKMTISQFKSAPWTVEILDRDRLAVKVTVYVSRRGGDIDNYGKSVLDGMQKAGIFKNDSQFDSAVFRRKYVPKGEEGIMVSLYQVEGTGYDKKDAVSPFAVKLNSQAKN